MTGAPGIRRIDAHAIRGRADAGAAEISADLRRIAAHAIAGPAEAGPPHAFARLGRVIHFSLRGLAESGAPQVSARVERVPPASEHFARTIPERRVLTALEIRHPAVAQQVRVVNDTEDRTIEGNRYVALRFDARLGFDPLLGRAAVVMRHDPQTSPGLF